MRAALTAFALVWLVGCSDLTSDPTNSRSVDVSTGSWKVIGVTDGDTITVLTESQEQVKVRMQGIDAPESHQAFGDAAKRTLSDKVFGEVVVIEFTGRDRYGRSIGDVYIDSRWINQELVAEGFAWHYVEYSSDGRLALAETSARSKKLGLWSAPGSIAPWVFRRGIRTGTSIAIDDKSAPGNVAETVFVTSSGTKYHLKGCRHLARSRIERTLGEVRGRYDPCSVCSPPD